MCTLLFSGCSPTAPINTATPTALPAEAYWYHTYGNGQDSTGSDLILTPDGGFLIVGGIGPFQEPDTIGGIMLLRLDPQGNQLWQRTYGGEGYEFGSAIIEAVEGGYLIAGETTSFGVTGKDGYLVRVDDDGDMLWSQTYGGELDEVFNTILPAEDGGFYLVGNQVDPNDFITNPGAAGYGGFAGRSNVYLLKVDADGNTIWSHTVESDANIISADGLLSAEGDLYVLGSLIKFPEKDDDLILYKFSPEGSLIWTRTWEEGDINGYAFTADPDGSLIITGPCALNVNTPPDIFLLKVDPDGEQIWFNQYGALALYEFGKDVIVTGSGDYVVLISATSSLYSGSSSSILLSADTNGALLWETHLELEDSIKGGSLHLHPDGSLIITGAVITQDYDFRTILVKTDPNGSLGLPQQ